MYKIVFIALATISITGCATVTKNYEVAGVNESEGIVRLSYDTNPLEIATGDEAQALDLAKQSCEEWGFSTAQPSKNIGSQQRSCTSIKGLQRCTITKTFECLK